MLNRPEHYNTMTHDLCLALMEALDKVKVDPDVRVVVLYGAGPGYGAGADLKGLNTMSAAELVEYIPSYYGMITKKIIQLDKPVLSSIHGAVAGVTLSMALASDLRIMADDAVMRYPFVNIGLGPDGGSGWLLVRLVGYARAYDIVTSGEKINAHRCLELGLTNRITTASNLSQDTREWAEQLAQKAPLAMGVIKRDLRHAIDHGLWDNIIYEAENQKKCLESADFAEGVMAFLQKRKPTFKGK